MKKRYYVTILVFILLAFWAALYLPAGRQILSNILGIYNNLGQNLPNFQKTNLGDIINSINREILAPGPLKVIGQDSSVVLTKAKIIAQTNIQRYNNGSLPPLIENAKLNDAALAKANDILKNQYFEHVSPTGVDPGALVKNAGYDYIISGENLILGNFTNEQEVVQSWMDSPGHRANILNDRFLEIGVAVVKGAYEGRAVWVGVQEFGLPLSFCQSPSQNLKSEIDNNILKLDSLSAQINDKKEEIENTNSKSSKYNTLVNEYNRLVNEYNKLNQITKNIIMQYNNQVNNFNNCVAGT